MSNSALAAAVLDAGLTNSAVTTLVLPWEQGVFSQIFDDATTGLVPLVDRPSDVRLTMQETAELPSGEEVARSSMVQHKGQCQCISSSEPGQGMIVQEDGKHVVEAYSDADWAGCKVTRKSVSGSAFLVNGQLVYSASRSQRLIALSSAESEYHAAISCAIDGLLIHAVVEFLFEGAVAPLRVLVDNAAARSMMLRQGVGRVRHIHARLLWIQQRVQLGEIIVSPVPTATNISDLMTKSLNPSRTRFLQNLLNVRDAENGYELVGREEAATQARAVQVCRVHRQVRAVVQRPTRM